MTYTKSLVIHMHVHNDLVYDTISIPQKRLKHEEKLIFKEVYCRVWNVMKWQN